MSLSIPLLDPPPQKEDLIKFEDDSVKSSISRQWEYWFNALHRAIEKLSIATNPSLLVNPDFHWSRVNGNALTISDGQFVEFWNVLSNGMIFSISPSYYTNTNVSSGTGSNRYININISVPNSNEFFIYQELPRMLSKLQNKKITFSSLVRNNNLDTIYAKFGIAFDINGDGIFENIYESKLIDINSVIKKLNCTISCGNIVNDNILNKVRFYMKIVNINNQVNLDCFYIKSEISDRSTTLNVEHILEKLKIDFT